MRDNKNQLFNEFEAVSSKEWKQKIQFELKGADYNDTLVWESLEGIKVKPFYHQDELENILSTKTNISNFKKSVMLKNMANRGRLVSIIRKF